MEANVDHPPLVGRRRLACAQDLRQPGLVLAVDAQRLDLQLGDRERAFAGRPDAAFQRLLERVEIPDRLLGRPARNVTGRHEVAEGPADALRLREVDREGFRGVRGGIAELDAGENLRARDDLSRGHGGQRPEIGLLLDPRLALLPALEDIFGDAARQGHGDVGQKHQKDDYGSESGFHRHLRVCPPEEQGTYQRAGMGAHGRPNRCNQPEFEEIRMQDLVSRKLSENAGGWNPGATAVDENLPQKLLTISIDIRCYSKVVFICPVSWRASGCRYQAKDVMGCG